MSLQPSAIPVSAQAITRLFAPFVYHRQPLGFAPLCTAIRPYKHERPFIPAHGSEEEFEGET